MCNLHVLDTSVLHHYINYNYVIIVATLSVSKLITPMTIIIQLFVD